MPFPEQGGQYRPEQDPSSPYIKAARFDDEPTAAQVYLSAQETIFASSCDLSCFRFQLDQVNHVAILGSQPPPEVDAQLTALLQAGELTVPAEDVQRFLQSRRVQAGRMGSWVEGHYRPGKRFRL